MGFIIDSATEPLLGLLLAAYFAVAFGDGRHGDALLRQRAAARLRLFHRTSLAMGLVACVLDVGLAANGGEMTIMLHGLLLLVLGLMAFSCFLGVDALADRLLGKRFIDRAAEELLLRAIPTYLVLKLGVDGERSASRRWLFFRTMPAAWLLLSLFKTAVTANERAIIRVARWKLRGLPLLTTVLNVTNCFLALDAAANKLLGEDSVSSFGFVRVMCALFAAATHLLFARAAMV